MKRMLDLLYSGKTDAAFMFCPSVIWYKYLNDYEFGFPQPDDMEIWLLLIAVAEGEKL